MDNILLTIFKLFFLGIYDCLINLTTTYRLDKYVATINDRKTERKEREILSSNDGIKEVFWDFSLRSSLFNSKFKANLRSQISFFSIKSIRLYLNRHKVFKCLFWCVSLSIIIYGSISVFYSYLIPFLKSIILFIFAKLSNYVSLPIDFTSEIEPAQNSAAASHADPTSENSDSQIFLNFDQLWVRVETILSSIFNGLWLLPLFIVSKIVCSFWFNEVAENCYYITYKKKVQNQPISIFMADLLFSVLVQLVFMLSCNLIMQFPIYGANYTLNLIHCSLLHAWYAFEYKWINFGWDFKKRILQLHVFWPYYVGFGLPMHLIMTELVNYLSDYKQGILSGCLFSAFFPMMIISAISTCRELSVEKSSTITLKLFQPSVIFSDWLLVKIQSFNSSKKVSKKRR